VALDEARKLEDGNETGELAYLIAEAMTSYGQPLEGAKLLREVLTQKPAVPDPGKLQVLRLTCLYKAEDYKVVSQDANQCLKEKRYPHRRVQFLYLAWAATRRVGEADKADKLAGDFLRSYPRHPLAADMLYAKAMGSLAQADYDGACDTLEKIAREFPDARVNERAGKLLARLDRLRTRDKDK
jgi:tetratricopeptide (TPR) repeat protein